MRTPALLAFACAIWGVPAAAGPACGSGFWALDDIPGLTLGTVRPGEKRAYFVSDEEAECPSAAPACRRRDYLVAGDTVVIEQRSGDFVCAAFVNTRGTATVGWLPAAAIEATAAPPPAKAADFLGKWSSVGAELRIARGRRGLLAIEGDATYPTAGGSVNTGEVAADAAPRDGELYFGIDMDGKTVLPGDAGEFGCVVRLRRLGPYLVAADNLSCGGHNVTFTGVYTRR
jgi:hypothetical protein